MEPMKKSFKQALINEEPNGSIFSPNAEKADEKIEAVQTPSAEEADDGDYSETDEDDILMPSDEDLDLEYEEFVRKLAKVEEYRTQYYNLLAQ